MCGIAGIVHADLPEGEVAIRLGRMSDTLVHRGPDEAGTVMMPDGRTGLACRRLSIVDLAHGSQPMANEDGSVHVVFNGEIYNHSALRDELSARGHRFRSRCDTEVLVHLYEEHGVECLDRLRGMFALAVFDTRLGQLLIARDHAGMKPLYFADTGRGLLFASEAKAILASGLVRPEPDLAAVDAFLAMTFMPAPMTGFRGIEKLPAGSYRIVQSGTSHAGRFWSLRYQKDPLDGSDEVIADRLEQTLAASVQSHLGADVPVGAYLSGGWDSSLVTAMAARSVGDRLKTFSIVFPDDPRVDESQYSRLVAHRLGTDHHEIEFRSADVPHYLQRVTEHMEEPCSAVPSILLYRLSSLASRHVKVVLGGEGADELFGGYPWVSANACYAARRILPPFLLRPLADRVANPRWRRVARVLSAESDVAADAEWFRGFTPLEKAGLLRRECRADGPDLQPLRPAPETLASCTDRLQRRLSLDFSGRLADAILSAGDKMSMANSVEVRMPFLDRSVIDLARSMPSSMKVRRGQQKYVVSLLAKRWLPEISHRRKQGLSYPMRRLVSGALRPFLREFLLDGPITGGLLDRRFVEAHLDSWLVPGPYGGRRALMLLFLQSWWNQFFTGRPRALSGIL